MPNLEILTSKSDNCTLREEALVEELLDPDTGQWNRTLISNAFNQHEALNIVSIPISQSLPKDKISAYHLLNKIGENLQPGPSHHRNDRLWKALIPNKIKNFMWRLAKNILPTRHNLQRKGIVLDTSCPLCGPA